MHKWQKFLRTKDACEYAGITKRTLYAWRKLGLNYSKLPSGSILYDRDEIDRFVRSFEVNDDQVSAICDEILEEI